MPANNTELLKALVPGTAVSIYPDYAALEAGKIGLVFFSLVFLSAAIYLAAVQFKVISSFLTTYIRQPVFMWIGIVVMLGVSYVLYDKTTVFEKLNDGKPLLRLTQTALEYDTRHDGWSMRWDDIKAIEMKIKIREKRYNTKEETREVRVIPREHAVITWYDLPAGYNIERQKAEYLLIDPEPLNVSHETLAKALEYYRQNTGKNQEYKE